jgi:hypothetical protein
MTATVESTKLELLQARETELAIAVEEARARVAAYPEQLHEARSRAIYAKPNVRPGAELNSEVSKLNAKEKKDLDSLRALEADLAACRAVLAVEAERVTEEETAEARARLAELHEKEEAVWKRAGELVGELATIWNTYIEVAEKADRFTQESGLEGSDALAVTPAPASFRSFLLLLLVAATDAEVRADPFEEQLSDIGVFGRRDEHGSDIGGAVYDVRPAGTRQVEVRRRLDNGDRLYHLTPDLRSVVRALQLSGHVPTIASE